MILGIFLVIPSLLATWVSYWSTNLFSSLSNRISRTVCLVAPGVLALLAAAFYNLSGTEIQILSSLDQSSNIAPHGHEAAALLLALTTVLIVATLLLAGLMSSLVDYFAKRENREI
jgi:hypothetical protein